ncbi:recombinase family protein [Azospirillum soli]|uniref:recombinase family protein n=1 Tax=Azospirillum soli TaxID=1304799 RepID=UPI001AE1E929|nr:recombinase family protein [Azospirillum soli]MBP2312964.1 DNA invertase Pin-like site-specific DNA recombinase [Azospirillum soli]
MNSKITPDHLGRGAIVYVRQSTMSQVVGNTESQKRQYALVEQARAAGFVSVTVIDDDLGRSGSGLVERPGFQRLVAAVCAGSVGAVLCLEASRLARNGRDWHHLVDLCALAGTLVIDPDGVYDSRLVNDRLLLGLKGTMSEYELSLLRQRGLEARDSKARRGELRFTLPPGYCWTEAGRIEVDPDERVSGAIHMVLAKFRELGSARQVFLWSRQEQLMLPVVQRNLSTCKILWRAPAYHSVMQILRNPIYAGAYAFGRTGNRTTAVDGRARKTSGHHRAMADWGALLHDHHDGYITWREFEENQRLLQENAHMQKRASRKAARGGRALLTGLVRCGHCGRMMRVFYGMRSGHAHRYQCRGDDAHVGAGLCIGIGGVRIDRAVVAQMLEAVSGRAVEAALLAADQMAKADDDVRQALQRDLEGARYDASLAARRYDLVDPAKRHVVRELEARWNTALERVAQIERRLADLDAQAAARPRIDREALMRLAHDLPAAWNAPTTDARTRQRLTHILVHEVVIDLDDAANEAVVLIHWVGGCHTEVRVPRVKTGRYPADRRPSPVEVMRKLGGQWPDRELAVTMNRMRCKTEDGETWTTVKVCALRERLGIAPFDPADHPAPTIGADEAASRLGICVGSVQRLIRQGILPATQLMPSAPWKIPVDALSTEAVQTGVREIQKRRPRNFVSYQRDDTMRLPGI